jgi:hypothetical protein
VLLPAHKTAIVQLANAGGKALANNVVLSQVLAAILTRAQRDEIAPTLYICRLPRSGVF